MICPWFPPFLLAPVGLVAYGGWFLLICILEE